MGTGPMDERRRRSTLLTIAAAAAAIVLAVGYAREIALHLGATEASVGDRLFMLNAERNVPAWFSVLLLFGVAAAMLRTSYREFVLRRGTAWGWLILGLGFVYLGLDEQLVLHERLGREHGELTNFSWVKYAVPAVVVLALCFVPFLLRLPRDTAWRLLIAGCIYVGGAVGFEIADGWILVTLGPDSVLHTLSICIEETMEIIGAFLALRCVVLHLSFLPRSDPTPEPAAQ